MKDSKVRVYKNCAVWVSYRGKSKVTREVGDVEVAQEHITMVKTNLESVLGFSNRGINKDKTIELDKLKEEGHSFSIYVMTNSRSAGVIPIKINGKKARAIVTWEPEIRESIELYIQEWDSFGLLVAGEITL